MNSFPSSPVSMLNIKALSRYRYKYSYLDADQNQIVQLQYKLINRQMIKHLSPSPTKKSNEERHYNEFETFQFYPNEAQSAESNKDSLLFSQSRKVDETNKQIGQIMNNFSKQEWREYQSRSRGSSIKKNKVYETLKDNSQGETVDPLSKYVISSFDHKNSNLNRQEYIDKNQRQGYDTRCKCKALSEEHKKQIVFLTKNNQQLYELNKNLTQQLSEIAKKYENLQRQCSRVKKEYSSLLKENYLLRENNSKMEEKYYERQKKYMKQNQINLKNHEKELRIVSQISSCLQEKERRSKERYYDKSSTKLQRHEQEKQKRSKTEYCYEQHHKNGSTTATWEGSNLKYTPVKLQKSREMISADKLRSQIDKKVSKLSQQKKKIMERVAKQNLTIEALQTEIPQSALSKMSKGNVGKLTLAKSTLGKSTSLFGGSSFLAATQKKCR